MSEERIVSETTLGGSDPISRYGRGIVDSIKGIGGGFISILIGFAILYYSVGMKENSGMVAKLPLTPAVSATTTQTGLVKITGKPEASSVLSAPKTNESVVYYKYTTEEFRKVEQTTVSTKTVQKDGKDVQQQVETKDYVDTWVPKTTDEKWGNLHLGAISILPQAASNNSNFKKIYNQEQVVPVAAAGTTTTPVVSSITYNGKTANAQPVTKTREVVIGIPADQNLVVIGEINNGIIQSGDPFIISNKTDAEIVADLKSSENLKFWLMKGAAWIFIAGGLTALLGPIFAIMNFLPGLGSALNGLVFFANAIIAALIVLFGSLVIKFWYVFLVLLVGGVIAGFTMKKKPATKSA